MFFSEKIDPVKENERLNALYRYNILDTPPDETFDRITRIVSTALHAPIALMTLIDRDRQWFKSKYGTKTTETSRDISFCSHTVQNDDPLIVYDLLKDERFKDNPFVAGEPHLRFYCGVPLRTKDGFNIGSLCILDRKPRSMSHDEMSMIIDLARLAINEIELRNMTMVDYLTNAATRRALYDRGDSEIKTVQKNGGSLSVCVFDIDHFKAINAKHSQVAGDAVLAKVVETCLPLLKQDDLLARVGGEEFAVLMPGTSLEDAVIMADTIGAAIEAMETHFSKATIKISCSRGITTYYPGDKEFAFLLNRGFAALLRAKRGGRQKSVVIDPVAEPNATTSCLENALTV